MVILVVFVAMYAMVASSDEIKAWWRSRKAVVDLNDESLRLSSRAPEELASEHLSMPGVKIQRDGTMSGEQMLVMT